MANRQPLSFSAEEMKIFRWLVLDGMQASSPLRDAALANNRSVLDGPVRSLPEQGPLPFDRDAMIAVAQFFDLGRGQNHHIFSDRERAPGMQDTVDTIESKIVAFARS